MNTRDASSSLAFPTDAQGAEAFDSWMAEMDQAISAAEQARDGAVQRADACEGSLRSLASWASRDGYKDATFDPWKAESVIRKGFEDQLQQAVKKGQQIHTDFITRLRVSRDRRPKNDRMFDGLLAGVHDLKEVYEQERDPREAALDVASIAYRLAVDGDDGGNLKVSLVPPSFAQGAPLPGSPLAQAVAQSGGDAPAPAPRPAPRPVALDHEFDLRPSAPSAPRNDWPARVGFLLAGIVIGVVIPALSGWNVAALLGH